MNAGYTDKTARVQTFFVPLAVNRRHTSVNDMTASTQKILDVDVSLKTIEKYLPKPHKPPNTKFVSFK